MTVTLYEVGGAVRDEILGVPTKDVDYTAVCGGYGELRAWLDDHKFEIFVESPQYFTIRARFPKGLTLFAGRNVAHLTADFVLARKEGTYTDGRRPDEVKPGTLMDDLKRRDFTVNAIAKDIDGKLIDPFDGVEDLRDRRLRAVGDPESRLREDALRALRAVRFEVTKGLAIDGPLMDALRSEWLPPLLGTISVERKREELLKAFKHDSHQTLRLLHYLGYDFMEAVFEGGLWLMPTLKG